MRLNNAIRFVEEVLNEGSIMKEKTVRKTMPIQAKNVFGHTQVKKGSAVLFDIHNIKKYNKKHQGNLDDFGQD